MGPRQAIGLREIASQVACGAVTQERATGSVTVSDVVALLESAYPPDLAAPWDAVGLTCGDPQAAVTRVLLAVDPTSSILAEAQAIGAELIVTHHPLLLRPVHAVSLEHAKGRVIHALIRSGLALFTAHTNADHADPGVSDALAHALGLRVLGPLTQEGAGRLTELAEAESLAAFADRVSQRLPATAHGVRVAGDLGRPVRRVAVCGGAGDFLLGAAVASADVFVTADLRHHRAGEHLEDGGCALVDVSHWASEWPWLEQAAGVIRGAGVDAVVSTTVTDPWADRRG